VGGLHIDDDVQRTVIEGQVLGITDAKFEPVDSVSFAAEINRIFRYVDARSRWLAANSV
jgi:hypothetical protein